MSSFLERIKVNLKKEVCQFSVFLKGPFVDLTLNQPVICVHRIDDKKTYNILKHHNNHSHHGTLHYCSLDMQMLCSYSTLFVRCWEGIF